MKRIVYIFIILPLLINCQIAQNWQSCSKEELVEAWKKTCVWLSSTNSYSFAMKYASYKDHLSNVPYESATGYYKRSQNSFKSYMNNVVSLQNNKVRIVVDSANREMHLLDMGSLTFNVMETSELVKLLDNVRQIKKMTIGKSMLYRIDFARNKHLESYEFKINGSQMLEQLVYYYSDRIEQEFPETGGVPVKETKLKPRLQIDFFDYKYPLSATDNSFNESIYVTKVNGKYKPVARYSGYSLSDSRYNDKN